VITATAVLDPQFTVAPVPQYLFGSLVEHMGRCVYGGIFEPGHPESGLDGQRLDVLKLTRELGVTLVRYPGGNFVSGYHWEDGVGPVEDRPTRLDLAWHSVEPNTFGLDEFMVWAREAQVEPMMAVNLGTRGITEACALLEYANHPRGTRWSDLRRSHGVPDPYGIRLWCLGNEMDGSWQVGHKTARDYGLLAAETAKAMRSLDPDLQLVVCGSSNTTMPSFGAWEAEVLEHTYDHVDYLSLHAYFAHNPGDRAGFLASATAMDTFIDAVTATADHVGAKKRSRRKLQLSFDEWNLWYQHRPATMTGASADWEIGPRLIEDEYTVEDAVVVGNLLMSLLRHSDRVGVACLAQLVNVIAPIRTEPDGSAWRQTIFHPFALTARYARGDVLRVEPRSSVIDGGSAGDVPAIDVVATHDPGSGDLTVLAVNRHPTEDGLLDVTVRDDEGKGYVVVEHLELGGADLHTTNTAEYPERVNPATTTGSGVNDGHLTAVLRPVSWNLIRLTPSAR
jgi:alpha-N-arabinofuranosidase